MKYLSHMDAKTKDRIKRWIYNPIKMLFYNSLCKTWIMLFGKKDKRKLKYEVSLCLIFNNEAPFLKEWIDYHLTVGVQHFYLYNNNSTDNYKTVIDSYIQKGIITLIDWPYQQAQMRAYQHCYENFRHETKWISFLDADEFICPKYKLTIQEWLEDFSKFPAVNIQWLIFGTNGLTEHDFSKNVIEQYHLAWNDFYYHGKCIINTRYDIANYNTSILHHHTYMYYKIAGLKMVLPAINQFGYICTYPATWGGGRNKLKNSTIQINHYYSKAWDIYASKMKKSDVFFQENPKGPMRFYRNELPSTQPNYTIYRFLIKMKFNQNIIKW